MKQYKNADGTRAKNVYVNSAITLIGQIVQILLGFIVRRLFIRYLGNSYLGYDSVFSNILQMLNIADLGISVAVTSFMYVPLAKKEQEAINALMYLYKRVYQMIGVFVLALGVIVSVFLPVLIPDAACSAAALRFYFYISLAGTVSTYYLSYKRTLLVADQKSYIAMLVDTIVFIVISLLQIILLICAPDYALYLVSVILKNIAANIIISVHCNRRYPYLKASVNQKLYKNYKPQVWAYVKDMFVAKVGAYIFHGTDNLVLSVFCGSLRAGYLSNYSMITLQVNNVITQILSSVQSVYGNYISETEDKNLQRKMTDNYFFVNAFLGNFCMLCVMFLIQPFVQLVFGKLYVLDETTAGLMAVNLMLTIMLQLPSQVFTIYRLYHYDRMIIAVSAVVNITISVAMVCKTGINGVLIGTFVASLIYLFSRYYIIAKHVYDIPYWHYIYRIGRCFLIAALSALVLYTMTGRMQSTTIFGMGMKIVCVVILAGIVPLVFFSATEEFNFVIETMLPEKLKKFFSKYIIWSIIIAVLTCIVVCEGWSDENSNKNPYKGSKSAARTDSYINEMQIIQEKKMHVSFDDVIDVFIDLTQNEQEYESIFDNEMLAWLKDLHEKYGMKAACYVFYEDGNFNLAVCTTKFRNEFEDNADWLKFGFHSLNASTVYGKDETSISGDYRKTIESLERVVSKKSITSTIRLQSYTGTKKEIEKIMFNSEVPVTSLLCADDQRRSYYLSEKESNYIYSHDEFFDPDMRLRFISTDLRIEYIDSINEKIKEFSGTAWNNQLGDLVVFTHEWAIDDEVKNKLENILMWGSNNEYVFSFLE